jgi:virginiamycin A acetyltransferase
VIPAFLRRAVRRLRRPEQARSARPIFLADDPVYARYRVGEWSYGSPSVLTWGEGATLVVGRFCAFAQGVVILLGGEHRTDWITTYPFNVMFPDAARFQGHPRAKGDVVIGCDVWVGRDALILSGVAIGNGAVVAARSVVTRDVAPYSIVAGNPARHVRFRFPEETIAALQAIAWWDWPLERIKEAWPLLLSGDVEAFIARYGNGG